MQRILHIADPWGPFTPSSMAYHLCAYQERAGMTAQVVCLDRPGATGRGPGDDYVRLRHATDLAGWQRLKTIARRFAPTAIHLWGMRACAVGGWLQRCCPRARLVASPTCRPPNRMGGQWPGRAPWPRIEQFLVPSEEAVDMLPSGCRKRCRVVPWAVPPRPDRAADDRATVLSGLGIPRNAHLFVSALPLEARCRLKDVVWAADLLACIRDDIYCVVFGDGPQAWRLQKFAGQQGVGRQFRLMPWCRLTGGVFEHALAFVQPSSCYFDYTALLAAMASGTPPVIAGSPLSQRVVRHGYSGFQVEPGARNEMARCINYLADRPDRVQRLGACAEAAVQPYDLASLAGRLDEVYGNDKPLRRAA